MRPLIFPCADIDKPKFFYKEFFMENTEDVAGEVAATPAVEKKKCKLWVKITCIALAAVIGIIAVLGITFACVWSDEISSVRSFTKLRNRKDSNQEGAVYMMRVKGGFYFDDFLAQGGASSDKQLINFITNNITRGLIDVSIGETDIGCSSFTAVTPSGDIIFARNYDFAKTNVCLTFTDPKDGRHKSFSTVDLNYIGMDINKDVEGLMNQITCLAAPYVPLDGMNDAGVSCGIYMSYQGGDGTEGTVATNQNDAAKQNITSTTMLRLVLDYADNVDEAVELIKKYNLHDSANTSFHYMVADATGKSAILEWLPAGGGTDATDNDGSARELVVTYNTDEMYNDLRASDAFKYQWVTNFIVNGQDSYYTDNEAKPGYGRYEHIYDRLRETNGVVADERAAMQILSEVGQRTFNGGGGCTVHSAVFNLTKKTVLWVPNENYDDKNAYFTYSFATDVITPNPVYAMFL